MAERYPFSAYPNGWFRVEHSEELAVGDVKPLRTLGRDLVIYRGEDRVARVLDAHCPHLGAHLGHGGRVEGDAIRCPFHAWKWDGQGRCLEIPYSRKIPSKAQLRAWETCEKNGFVFVWHHRDRTPPSFELPDLAEYGSEAWTPYEKRFWKVRAHWLDMNENAVDQVHFKYVHGAHTIPETQVEIDGAVLRCRSRMKLGTPKGEVEGGIDTTDYGPGFQTVQLSGISPALMVNTVTPIDETYSDVCFSYTVKIVDGASAARGVGAALIRDLEKQMNQDIPIWENKKYFPKPLLCEGDGRIGVYRKWLRQFVDWDPKRLED
ncbi:MAG: Rieske (2Fe-2S) protein [Deltaproteobacteria bacterium]|nr:MAG: Rieske (2Fe-2S) protein [Deltaproteobacteria bacterium]